VATHREIDLSYRAGWMVRSNTSPTTVPALIRTSLDDDGAWHVLDDDAYCRLATNTEVAAAGLDPELTLTEAMVGLGVLSPVEALMRGAM